MAPASFLHGRRVLGAALVLAILPVCQAAENANENSSVPSAGELAKSVAQGHPRLLLRPGDFERLGQRVAEEPPLTEWHQRLRARADRILREAPSKYEIPDGLRLLSTSRRVLDRTYTLALIHRLDGGREYLERAWKELEAAAQFPDWNPRHFLDTAEMTHAFAIGYDWLFDSWTAEQRDAIRNALIEKGLKLGLECYEGQPSFRWWTSSRHNWNQVCNGGIGMGALAVADEVPEIAGPFLRHALQSLRLPMNEFAPDGAWSEGPGYWNYATTYNAVFLAAMDSAVGRDFGLSESPGFSDTGLFPIYLTGPLGRTFNYADGGEGTIRAPHMFWMARKFDRPVYAWYQRQVASPTALDLVWFQKVGVGPRESGLPLDRLFRGVEVATFRSAWEDREALFVGFKAGDNKANHSNLDLGSFVLDALGHRWAVDLGADNYNLPGYFGGQRWTYYRMRAEGHNTLVINPGKEPDQDPRASARIERFDSAPERAFAIADLTPAYANQATQVKRGIAMHNRSAVLVQDEIQAKKPSDVWWFFHTPAQIDVDASGAAATLTQGTAKLSARILAPTGAQFTAMSAQPLAESPHPERQAANESIRKLAIHLNDAQDATIAVLLTPIRGDASETADRPRMKPLGEW